MYKLSVIIPTLNELKMNYFSQVLRLLYRFSEVEIAISDGGSTDGTLDLANKYSCEIVNSCATSRAQRMNAGIAHSKAEMVLLHHPRSLIEFEGIRYLIKNAQTLTWGGFTHRFDVDVFHPLLAFTSWYSNNVRGKVNQTLYLDHCIFCQKYILKKIGPIPKVDIFEDTHLSRLLSREVGQPFVLPFKVKTSAVRFTENGIYIQAFMNQYLKFLYHLGVDHRDMNKKYERNVTLNAHYNDE